MDGKAQPLKPEAGGELCEPAWASFRGSLPAT